MPNVSTERDMVSLSDIQGRNESRKPWKSG